MKSAAVFSIFALAAGGAFCSPADMNLPAPSKTGGMPLIKAFTERKTSRSFDSTKKLSEQQLSNLLYAACGVNRPDGRRTIGTARNLQEIHVYAVTQEGVYLYDAAKNRLLLKKTGDFRTKTYMRPNMPNAVPVILVYVSDTTKFDNPSAKVFYPAVHAGSMSQNVYLYCASEGLATVVCGLVDKKSLEKALDLPSGWNVQLTQMVGYPKK